MQLAFAFDESRYEARYLHFALVGARHLGVEFRLYLEDFRKFRVVYVKQIIEVRSADDDDLHVDRYRLGAQRRNRYIAELLREVFYRELAGSAARASARPTT